MSHMEMEMTHNDKHRRLQGFPLVLELIVNKRNANLRFSH